MRFQDTISDVNLRRNACILTLMLSSFCCPTAFASPTAMSKHEIESEILENTFEVILDGRATETYYIWTKDHVTIVGSYKSYSPKTWRFIGDDMCYEYDEGTSCTTLYRLDGGGFGAKWSSEKTRKIWPLRQEALSQGKLGFLQVLSKSINLNASNFPASDRSAAASNRSIITKELSIEQEKYRQEQVKIDADPSNNLLMSYKAYIFVKSCFEARKSYASVYITEQELNDTRVNIKGIESSYKAQLPTMNIEKIWAKATSDTFDAKNSFLSFDGTRDECQRSVNKLRLLNEKLNPNANKITKDF